MLGAQGGQVRLREEMGSKVLTVNVDRIDARVIDPCMQVIGDDRETLQAQIATLRVEKEALRLQKEHEKDLLRGEITSLQSNATEQVFAALALQLCTLQPKANHHFFLPFLGCAYSCRVKGARSCDCSARCRLPERPGSLLGRPAAPRPARGRLDRARQRT